MANEKEESSLQDSNVEAEGYAGDFRIVAQFLDLNEANLLRAYLESCSIPAYVADADLLRTNPFMLGGGVGGTSVRVPEAYVKEALECIASFQRGEVQVEEEQVEVDAKLAVREKIDRPQDMRVKAYRVYAHPDRRVPIVVKEGFSWGCLVFGALWFLFNGMWLSFLIVGLLQAAGGMLLHSPAVMNPDHEFTVIALSFLFLFLWIFVAFMANGWLASHLEGKGYKLIGRVNERNVAYAREAAVRMRADAGRRENGGDS